MRDMKGGRGRGSDGERIEPRIGATPVDKPEARAARRTRAPTEITRAVTDTRAATEKKDQPATSARRERLRAKPESEAAAPGDARVVRDVLLESPSSRYVATEFPATRQDASTKRERGYTKASPHGRASSTARTDKVWNWNFSWLNRKLASVVFVMALLIGIYWISEPIARLLERPIKSVVVEGEFNFITKKRATDLISNEIDRDFLQLDLMQLKNALMSDPWVENVTLNRRWPDTLVVKIAEQKPIARWGNGFLNQRGEIVRVEETDRLLDLPWLQGNELDATEILQQYQDLSQLLRSRGLEVVALKCDNKKSWRLTIKNDVEIAIGRDQVMEKMRRFVTVYDTHLSHIWNDVKAIDIRYSNGVAVRWVDGSEMAKKYIKSHSQSKLSAPKTSVTP